MNPLTRLLHKIAESPRKIMEAAQHLLLGWVLLETLIGFGGFLAYGEPMSGISLSLFLLTALHAINVTLRDDKKGMDWELLLPLPFILYAWLSTLFLSPAPWNAALYLTVYVQAYALYFVVFNSIRGTRSCLWIFLICQFVGAAALLAAFFQYYLFPGWMISLARERNPAYLEGAAGFLMDPSNLASLLMLFWPVSVLIVWARRFSGPVRILNGFYAIALFVGILVSAERPGLWVILGVLACLPLFMTKFPSTRWKLWLYGALALAGSLPLFWFGTDTLHSRMVYFLTERVDPLGTASLQSGWQLFLGHPLFGSGLGSFAHLWELNRPEGLQGTSLYSISSYAGILAEMGLVGLCLLGFPVVILLLRGFTFWKEIPYTTVNKDVQSRMNRYPKNHPGRLKLEKAKGRTPSAKVILGGLMLGFASFLVYIVWDYSFNLPIHLFIFASLLAVLAAISRGERRRTVASSLGIATSLVPVLLAGWALAYGPPKFYSQYTVFTEDEELAHLLEDTDRIFLEPESLTVVLESYRQATGLNPANPYTWLGLGRVYLARIHADVWPSNELAEEAGEALGRALELAPDSWLAHFEMARSLAILGEQPAAVEGHLQRAISLAPGRPEPRALLGSLLLYRDPDSAEGINLLEKALELDPQYEPGVKAFRRLGIAPRGGEAEATTRSSGGSLSEALIAESFILANPGEERVQGAGIRVQPDEFLPSPE